MEIPVYSPESIGSAGEAGVIDEPVGHPSDPCVMVIFGASGDLTKTRKRIPAHYNLAEVLTRTVRGQYRDGSIGGEHVPGYRAEPRVPQDSRTETFVALKLLLDSWRWADVPFYLRTGKRLPQRVTEVAIRFKRAPFMLFRKTYVERLTPKPFVLHIQPDEGISLRFGAKIPDSLIRLGYVASTWGPKEADELIGRDGRR